MKGSNSDAILDNPKQKGSNLGAMPENSNQNKGIKSGLDIEEFEMKGKDRI